MDTYLLPHSPLRPNEKPRHLAGVVSLLLTGAVHLVGLLLRALPKRRTRSCAVLPARLTLASLTPRSFSALRTPAPLGPTAPSLQTLLRVPLVLERRVDLGAIGDDLALLHLEIHADHFSNA
jgi:hypothetical protein